MSEEELRELQDRRAKRLLNLDQEGQPVLIQPSTTSPHVANDARPSTKTRLSRRGNIEYLLKTTGTISFVADCIAIYLFIRQLLAGQSLLLPSDRMISLAVVIILAFVLSLSLIRFSDEDTGSIFSLFGMVYAVYGAVFLSITSYYSIDGQVSQIDQLSGYFILTIVIAAFCYVVMRRAEINMRWAAIPYILASIFHIGFVLFTVTSKGGIPFVSHISLVLGIVFISVLLAIGQA